MAGSGLWTVAEKEFFDHIRSRKFLLIFGIFLVIAIIGMIGGISEYNASLEDYNDALSVASSADSSFQGPNFMTEKPSILSVFSTIATYLVFLGGILGIAMGFDLITKEKESKSLKILLSHPLYRDEVINGKALGSILALCVALGIVLVLSLAFLLICGIIPEADEMAMIAVFAIVSFLLIFSYFAIALFMSTVSDDSGSALIYTIIIFIALSSLVPTISEDSVMENLIGSQPEMPQELLDTMQPSASTTASATASGSTAETAENAAGGSRGNTMRGGPVQRDSAAWQSYNEEMQSYRQKRQMLQDTFALFSPSMNYETVTSAITSTDTTDVMRPGAGGAFDRSNQEETDTEGTIGKVMGNIIALLLFPAVFFGLAYMRFMRLDVR